MKQILIALFLCGFFLGLRAQEEPIRVLIIGAHPDDCDLDAGGTALLFTQLGHQVKFLSLTNGDAGHQDKGGGALARIRRSEAQEAGRRFGVEYKVLDNHDGELMPTLENRLQLIREIRNWNADIVIGPRPNDYHPDHRNTSILMQDAAFMVIVPNVAPDTPPVKKNPVFLYSRDHFQKPYPFEPDISVIIDDVFDQKVYGFSAHESQFFEWLPWTTGTLDEIPEGQDARLEYLALRRPDTPNDVVKENLTKWYGSKAAGAKHAEAFEICEYGKQPTDEEIRRLFPMLR
ncbi:MAG: PIG-L family deacetylase [Bacteroidales bacterium]